MENFIKDFLVGSTAFFLCAIFYCIFWGVSYNENTNAPVLVKIIFFTLTAIFGIASIAQYASGIKNAVYVNKSISNLIILIVAVATYIILAFVTKIAFKRVITTELILIVFCTMGAFCVINSLYSAAIFYKVSTIIFIILTVLIFMASLVCYIIYYKLNAQKAFIIGFIPLTLYGALSLIIFIKIISTL